MSQVLPLFFYPLGIALCCLVLLFSLPKRFVLLFRLLCVLVFLVLFLGGNRYVSDQLLWHLEGQYPVLARNAKADVIFVLGGVTKPPTAYRQVPEIGEGGDRLTYAAQLYKEGRASKVLVSGGRVGSEYAEADTMSAFLMMLGVPENAILRETESRNTEENVMLGKELMLKEGLSTAILVTSAAHMRRASTIFQFHHIEHLPAPTDYRTSGLAFSWQTDILPQSRYLERSTSAIKEHYGYWYLLLKGD